MSGSGAITWTARRLGTVMVPDPADPDEAGGVLNPACARGRDGELYLFPRLVGGDTRSRVGRARVLFDDGGVPSGVERLGAVLEATEVWERNGRSGGVEDPRVTYLPLLDRWVMTYVAFGPLGPRVGLAVSDDLERWERIGPVAFAYEPALRTDLNLYWNKDALLFPEPVPAPGGEPAFAMLHRPAWDFDWNKPDEPKAPPAGLADTRPGIWVSFAPVREVLADVRRLAWLGGHRLVALPERPWEHLKIGGGTPPLRVPEGWLVLHHGVSGRPVVGQSCYAAGVLVLDAHEVTRVLARSATPLLKPELDAERNGVVPNVVFPTGIDPRPDGTFDVYYGMADSRIGAFRLTPQRPAG